MLFAKHQSTINRNLFGSLLPPQKDQPQRTIIIIETNKNGEPNCIRHPTYDTGKEQKVITNQTLVLLSVTPPSPTQSDASHAPYPMRACACPISQWCTVAQTHAKGTPTKVSVCTGEFPPASNAWPSQLLLPADAIGFDARSSPPAARASENKDLSRRSSLRRSFVVFGSGRCVAGRLGSA